MSEHFDAIVIGAGQAGPSLAGRLGQEGLKTAIIERHLMGGTCVNTGCIPIKTLVASARVAHLARRGADFGVNVDPSASGDETVHAMLDKMYAKQRYTVISRAVHIHPTASKLIPTVLQSLRPL